MTMTIEITNYERNSRSDFRDFTAEMPVEAPILATDIPVLREVGIDVDAVCKYYVGTREKGRGSFLGKMEYNIDRYGSLTPGQIRVVLNIGRDKENGFKRPFDEIPEPPKPCPDCGSDEFESSVAVLKHRMEAHGWVPTPGSREEADVAPRAVTKGNETQYDFSSLPNGLYTVPCSLEKSGLMYIRVKRLTKRTHFNKQYAYGKKITGSEWLEADTIVVRRWEGQSRECIGVQAPGHNYRGERGEYIAMALTDPETFAKLFSMTFTRCYICSLPLTDPTSQALLIGPTCEEKYGHNYHSQWATHKREWMVAQMLDEDTDNNKDMMVRGGV